MHVLEQTDLPPSQLQLYAPLPPPGLPDEPLADEASLAALGLLPGDTLRAVVDRSVDASCGVGGLAEGAGASAGGGRGCSEPAEQGFEGSVLLGSEPQRAPGPAARAEAGR